MYAVRLPVRTYIHPCGCQFVKKVSYDTTDLTPIHVPHPCRACHYGQCFSAQATINTKYLDLLVRSRTSVRIVQGLTFRTASASSTSTTSSQRERETNMLAEQVKIIQAFQAEERDIWRDYRERWESGHGESFHAESFLQFDDREILFPPKEPDTRHSTALVDAFDEGNIGLTSSVGESVEETWSEMEARIKKVEQWDGLKDVERECWPPSPLSPPR